MISPERKIRKIVVAIHGILTSQTDASWPDKFIAWCMAFHPEVHVLKREYLAGPFPLWNVFVKNKLIARGLANEIVEYFKLLGNDEIQLSFVSHSNGCDIALKTIKRLAKLGIETHQVILTGAAIQSDIRKNGVEALIGDEALGYATAYCSKSDWVVSPKFIWPYGNLGKKGFTRDGKPYSDPFIKTMWFDGYGHAQYFSSKKIDPNVGLKTWQEKTFEQLAFDLGFHLKGAVMA